MSSWICGTSTGNYCLPYATEGRGDSLRHLWRSTLGLRGVPHTKFIQLCLRRCHTATTRVGEIATPMNHTLAAARELGINIIFAPSDVTSFYSSSAARKRTLSLKNVTLPPSTPKFPSDKTPPFPLSSATDGGCDAHAPEGSPWKRQIATLTIDEQVDYLIAADLPSNAHAGTQELWNIMGAKGIKHLIYMGVVRYCAIPATCAGPSCLLHIALACPCSTKICASWAGLSLSNRSSAGV